LSVFDAVPLVNPVGLIYMNGQTSQLCIFLSVHLVNMLVAACTSAMQTSKIHLPLTQGCSIIIEVTEEQSAPQLFGERISNLFALFYIVSLILLLN